MRYTKFMIQNYRAIKETLTVDISSRIVPLVGVNECGKTTILQAIFCFDYINDKENGGYHLQNIENLYSTVSVGDCIISAEIECKRDELNNCVQKALRKKEKALAAAASSNTAKPNAAGATIPETTTTPSTDAGIVWMEDFISSNDKISAIIIKRNISKNKLYSCSIFDDISEDDISTIDEDSICQEIISDLPYILYNDDFNDRPVSSVSLADEKQNSWYDIFDRVFRSTNNNYSLKTITDSDERRRKSILSDVENFLSTTLTGAWSKFSPTKKEISISLEVDTEKNILQIYIKEHSKGKPPRFFKVSDRSKGFIWYYNFIMKIRFNPKQVGAVSETIFLLDEPGSYLHATAQAELCKKLRDISKKEGVVIYCTHSHQLLLPSIIPLNTVLLVEKKSNVNIIVTPVSIKNDTKSKRDTAMQPIYEALQLPEYEIITEAENVLCVEGIYDKYCIESFCELPENVRLFPSVSASAIVNNIQYFIAYQKRYLALWDNDKEGKKEYGQARKIFGDVETKNFALLPDVQNKGKVRMEEMITQNDYQLLKSKLSLASDATFETIISCLHFSDKAVRKKIMTSISDETKANFSALSKMITKKLIDKRDDLLE